MWTITGTLAAVNTALANVAFIPVADNDVDTTITTHIEDAAREMLDEFLAAARHKEPELKALKAAHSALVLGLPVSRILEVAKKEDAAMIIMGSKGETGLKHLLVGSIAEQVVHLAPIPVTIVKAERKDRRYSAEATTEEADS